MFPIFSEGTAAVDNFFVRSLGGPETFHKPVGSIDDADLEIAKQKLLKFEARFVFTE